MQQFCTARTSDRKAAHIQTPRAGSVSGKAARKGPVWDTPWVIYLPGAQRTAGTYMQAETPVERKVCKDSNRKGTWKEEEPGQRALWEPGRSVGGGDLM